MEQLFQVGHRVKLSQSWQTSWSQYQPTSADGSDETLLHIQSSDLKPWLNQCPIFCQWNSSVQCWVSLLLASGLPVCTWKHGSPRTEPYCPLWMTADGKANLLWNITVLIEMFLFFFINVLGQQLDSLRSAVYNPVKDFWTDEWTKYRTSSLWPSRASLNRGIWQVFSP